jgi:3-oxoacyl-[acyl-carrier-protein] synthase-3
VYKFACLRVPEVLSAALANAGLSAADVDHLLLHQANIRIIEAVANRLGIPMDKVRAARSLVKWLAAATWLG